MKADGGAGQNVNLEQGKPTQRAGTITLRNSVEILTNLHPCYGQLKGREGEGQIATQMHNLVLEIAQAPRASSCHPKLSKDPYVK